MKPDDLIGKKEITNIIFLNAPVVAARESLESFLDSLGATSTIGYRLNDVLYEEELYPDE